MCNHKIQNNCKLNSVFVSFSLFVLAYEQAGYKRKLECTSKWSGVQQNIAVVLFAMILSRDVPSHVTWTESF